LAVAAGLAAGLELDFGAALAGTGFAAGFLTTGLGAGFAPALATVLAGAALAGALTSGFFATALPVAGLGLMTDFAATGFAALLDGLLGVLDVLLATMPPPKFHLVMQAINGKT
jgi:hypothetical protein